MGAHENYQSSHETELPSERSFGIVMTVAFAVFGGIPWYKRGEPNLYLFGITAAFALFTLVFPRALRPLNIVWMKLGLLLGRIVTPLVMAVVFFGVVTPMSILMRLFGKDPLALKYEAGRGSYWIERTPPGPKGDSLKRQF